MGLLAHSVVEGLSLWPYALHILQRLCSIAYFRETLFQTHPHLVAQLLAQALARDDDLNRYSSLLLQLLSEPLPSHVPLPATAQDLFWRLFDRAVQTPSAASLEPVYLLLEGACHELLDILPQRGLDKLCDQLNKMIKRAKNVEEQLLSLYCLAILAKVHIQQQAHLGDSQKQHNHGPSAKASNEVSKLFTGDRGCRTLQLLVLQVIYACSLRDQTSEKELRRRAKLSRQISKAVDSETQLEWLKTSMAQDTSKKLVEKLSQPKLVAGIQLEALAFVAGSVDSAVQVPMSVIEAYHEKLFGWTHKDDLRDFDDAWGVIFPALAVGAQERLFCCTY